MAPIRRDGMLMTHPLSSTRGLISAGETLSKLALPVWVAGEPCGLGTPVASDDGPGPREGLVVPGRALLGVDPYRSP